MVVTEFIISVVASIAANYVCKWLDRLLTMFANG